MSGGTWNYRNEMVAKFLTEDIHDLQESSFYTDFPKLSNALFELGSALDEITHDLDWHYACDSQIEDMRTFEQEALEKLDSSILTRRPPAERLPDCEQLLEAAQVEVERLRAERDELIGMMKEILRDGSYISPSRRKAAYELVIRLGGYRGKTEGQDDGLR